MIAVRKPSWASEITSFTPFRPRATRSRRNSLHELSISVRATCTPRTSRSPSAFTPKATRTAFDTTRPFSRTFTYRASSHTYGNSLSSARDRKASTCLSSTAAIRETSDFDIPLAPIDSTSASTFRVDTPST